MTSSQTFWALAFVFLVGCPGSDDDGRPAAGSGGSTGGAGSAAGSGAGAGAGAAGSGAGATAGAGGATGGAGAGAAGSGGRAVAGAGGMSAAGRGAAGASGTTAGAGGAAGSGCTQNLACKLTAAASTGDVRQDCVDRINQFRTQCACLPPLVRWNDAEACADMMAEHDSMTMQAHSGFMGKVCTPGGNAQNECPGYRSESQVISNCLQQMWNEGPPPMTPCNGDCFQTYGHFINMTNTKYKKVACGFHATSDNSLWAVQNFSP